MSKFKSIDEYYAYSKTLSVIPTEDIINLLESSKIKIPFYVHRFILRETIYPKVFQTKLYTTYSDELKYRLRGYNDYSIYLLEKLVKDYNLDFDAAKYKENFFNFLFLNKELYNIKNSFLDELDKLKYKYTVDFEKIKYQDFINQFTKILYEPSGYLDGVNLKILKDVLVHSCTLGDLRGLGEKYGVKIPRRINKTKLVEILSARFRLSEEETTLLNEKSVLELEIYAKEKGFNISIDLKKSDMVEYLIYDLKMYHKEIVKDSHSYNIPLVSDLDSVKIDTISFENNDQDIPVQENVDIVPVVIDKGSEEEVSPIKEPVKEIVNEPMKETVTLEPVVESVEVQEEKQEEPAVVVKEEPVPAVKHKEEPKEEKKEILPILPPKDSLVVTDEEKELLDEKINMIIKKYKKRRRSRRILLTILFIFLLAVIGFVGYSYLYYTTINAGELPFGIPVFW